MGESITCSVCANRVTTTYCGNCGQKVGNKPINLWIILSDFFSNYFSFERSGLATLIQLLKRPRFLVENYYTGNKGYYSSPARLLIFSIVLFVLHTTLISPQVFGLNIKVGRINGEYAYWMLFLPTFFIVSQLTFIRQGFQPARHIISITYTSTGFFILLLFPNDLIFVCFGDIVQSAAFVFYLITVFFWNSWILSRKRKWWMYILNTFIEIVIFIALILLSLPLVSITSQ